MPFYAVKRGKCPGVYESWAECQNQIDGFAGAKFKKFATEEEAYTFAEIPMEKASKESSGEAKVFEKLITKFEDKVAELSSIAESMVTAAAKLDDSEVQMAFSEMVDDLEGDVTKLKATVKLVANSKFMETSGKRKSDSVAADAVVPEKKKKAVLDAKFTGDAFEEDDAVIVYTDGCCFHNGKHGASAGIGVYWGPDSEDNVSERLPGRQTNNRAEIHAVIKAVEQAIGNDVKNLVIRTDSMFLINCVTKWMAGWKKKGWVKSDGEEVTNKEELQELDAMLDDINIKWVHVDGHSGIPGNEAADKLANKGARRPLPE